eukprot:2718782-Rhodomonas_salina.1
MAMQLEPGVTWVSMASLILSSARPASHVQFVTCPQLRHAAALLLGAGFPPTALIRHRILELEQKKALATLPPSAVRAGLGFGSIAAKKRRRGAAINSSISAINAGCAAIKSSI